MGIYGFYWAESEVIALLRDGKVTCPSGGVHIKYKTFNTKHFSGVYLEDLLKRSYYSLFKLDYFVDSLFKIPLTLCFN